MPKRIYEEDIFQLPRHRVRKLSTCDIIQFTLMLLMVIIYFVDGFCQYNIINHNPSSSLSNYTFVCNPSEYWTRYNTV